MPRILVVGDVMSDIVVRLEGPIARGSDAPARIVERPGGSAATQAVWLARAGVEVDFVARVGAAEAERLAADFRAEGVTPWLSPDPDLPTGRLVALIEPGGERSFLTDRGANDALAPEDIPEAALAGADAVHLSGYTLFSPQSRATAIDLMRRAGSKPCSLDPGSAAPLRAVGAETFLRWTRGVALLLPNADEAEALTGARDPAVQGGRLAAHYPLVVIKRGAAGSEAYAGASRWSAPAPPTQVLDTTGAGDAFAAAFLAARLKGEAMEVCLARATAAGAAATGFVGGRPAGVPVVWEPTPPTPRPESTPR
jgi:sugar/nucleoside kinase (ribokinase family)